MSWFTNLLGAASVIESQSAIPAAIRGPADVIQEGDRSV